MTIGRGPVLDPSSYFAQSQSWRTDVVEALTASRRRAWWLAGAASLTSFVAVTAVALLVPLKTAVPYVIELERSTGYVQAARRAEPGTLSANEAIRQSNLYHYVLARESIDAADIAANYERTLVWSAGAARRGYLALWDESNPDGLARRYPVGTVVQASIKGVSPLGPSSALVRFSTMARDASGATAPPQHWQAVIAYRYASRTLTAPERFMNPLGFEVTSYRRDPDLSVETAS